MKKVAIKKRLKNIDVIENRITKKQYNEELKEAVVRIEKGEFYTHKDVMKNLSKW